MQIHKSKAAQGRVRDQCFQEENSMSSPMTPPPEVLEEMARAAQTYEELSSQGRELRFARDEQSGRTRIEVRDRAGKVLKTLTHAQALALAAGTPLE
jgi:hypothetical protein